MNKTYIIPAIKVKEVKTIILAGSGEGPKTNDKLGNQYTDTDVSYSKTVGFESSFTEE